MPRNRTITVISTNDQAKITTVQESLRSLRPLGLRFSTEQEDGGPTIVKAWTNETTVQTRAPRAPRTPAANTAADTAAAGVAGTANTPPTA